MADLLTGSEGALDPSLSIGSSMVGQRYPNQFFDLAQQYMPPTIKELFRWCTFYYYNSPLIGSTISKISRYPITDLIFESHLESTRHLWDKIFNHELKIKNQLMEINLDYHAYGNAFVSVHLPFTRFLICKSCKSRETIQNADWSFNTSAYDFNLNCSKCGTNAAAEVKDVPYKDRKGIRIIRWNPENIQVKYNEYTGKRIYMYSIPYRLKNAIQRGDKDIVEDVPLIVLQALKSRRLIRFNSDNFMHLRRPSLAEQDQGWGKPLIIHVLKDMYYLYTLRRAQEAIAMEHIVPFDIIYPLPNAQQDPYLHLDLANWRVQIEGIIRKHRRDPNFKGVIPIPVGFGRLGGDGKAMLLTPELNYLTQTIVGGMGIPQEFLFGGLNWTGSSISLRTLENDFIQNRSQLLDFVNWIKNKIRVWQNLPDLEEIRFADFRMADDVQRNQQLIGLNASFKVSDQTLLTELGFDYDQEIKKMVEEVYLQNYLNDMRAKASARSQGESQLIQYNYQNKIQELAQKAQEKVQQTMPQMDQMEQQAPQGWQQAMPEALPQQGDPSTQGVEQDIKVRVRRWANKLMNFAPTEARTAINELKSKMPDIGSAVEQEYNALTAAETQGGGKSMDNAKSVMPNMAPLPEKGAPTRAGMV
ncbi:MAG: hypothetical protein EBZ49_00155 [Proteobacteria bacterium]|nr:hypothetical protein [Pseudomonadota bacterium]